MKYVAIIVMVVVLVCGASAQQKQAKSMTSKSDSLLKAIDKIRKTTNWMSVAAATKAGAQIEKLSEEYEKQMSGSPKNASKKAPIGQPDEDKQTLSPEMMSALAEENVSAGNEEIDTYFAKPMQEELKAEYEAEYSPKILNTEVFDKDVPIVIDVAAYKKASDLKEFIDQLPKFKNVSTLIITTSKSGHPVDLNYILSKCSKFPLTKLYIINLKTAVSTLPDQVWAFKRLETIGIYNNSIGVLSESLGNLINLKRLYVDMNPIAALPKSIVRLTHLEELGVAKAQVRQGEINRVHASLPQCKVLQ